MILFGASLQGQKIKGVIKNDKNIPIEGVYVILKDDFGDILLYTVTDGKGAYNLDYQYLKEGFHLETNHMNFYKKVYEIPEKDLKNPINKIDFILEEKITNLQEFVIEYDKNQVKDTVKFDLKKTNTSGRDGLSEILERIPGFKIDKEDGTIVYKGKLIDKILVNKKETFSHQNSMALDGIEKEDLEGISIINNHFDNFDMEQTIPETVLNLDTSSKSKKIIISKSNAEYGYKSKYKFEGKGFLFSKNVNIIGGVNKNNVGIRNLNYREINNSFYENQPLSVKEINTIKSLLNNSINFNKKSPLDINLSLKKTTDHFKYDIGGYYVDVSSEKELQKDVFVKNINNPLTSFENIIKTNTSGVLGNISFSYKPISSCIIGYKMNANSLKNKELHLLEGKIFDGDIYNSSTINSTGEEHPFSIFQNIFLSKRIHKKLFLKISPSYFYEKTPLFYSYRENSEIKRNYNYYLSTNNFKGNTRLKYLFSEKSYSAFGMKYSFLKNTANDPTKKERTVRKWNIYTELSGDEIFRRFTYRVMLYYNNYYTSYMKKQITKYFLPFYVSIGYENNLHKASISLDRTVSINKFMFGTRFFEQPNSIIMPNEDVPNSFYNKDTFGLDYDFLNLFSGHTLSFSFRNSKSKNRARKIFVENENSLYKYRYDINNSSKMMSLDLKHSKLFYFFPVKSELDIGYSENLTKIPDRFLISRTKTYTSSASLKTILTSPLNLKLHSYILYAVNRINGKIIKYSTWTNGLSMIFKKGKYSSELEFKSFFSTDYKENNNNWFDFNIDFSYEMKSVSFVIEGRRILSLFGIFDQNPYSYNVNSYNGIQNISTNRLGLYYLMAGIKIKLP